MSDMGSQAHQSPTTAALGHTPTSLPAHEQAAGDHDPRSPTGCSMHPGGRRSGPPAGVRDAECSPICRVHSGLVPFPHIYFSI